MPQPPHPRSWRGEVEGMNDYLALLEGALQSSRETAATAR